ncbi:MAG: ABC transporter substrate-binding protein [Halobacteria archaeon]|nr:ABC transporter substrate-binding protein [Halobacteria archaeon]
MSQKDTFSEHRKSRREFLKVIGAGGIATSTGIAGCLGGGGGDGDGGGGQTYTIGSAVSLSGDLSPYGTRHERGMNMALERINQVGLKNGGKLEVILEDTGSAEQTGVSAAQKLVNQNGVPLLIGAVSSGVTMAIAQSVTIPNKVLHISPHSTSPKITGLDDDKYVLRAAPSDAFQGAAMAKLALEQGVKSASVIMINNDYGRGFADVLQQKFEEGGGKVLKKVPYSSGQASYKSQLNSAMEGDPGALMFIAYPQSFTTMAKQAFEMGIKDQVKYIGAESTLADQIKNNVPAKALEGMVGTTPTAPTESDSWKNFVSNFESKHGERPTVWSAYSFDATMLAALAIEAADSFDSKSLRDAIYPLSRPEGTKVSSFEEAKSELQAGNQINYEGVSGSVDLNEAGDVPGVYRWWKFTNGDYQMQGFLDV